MPRKPSKPAKKAAAKKRAPKSKPRRAAKPAAKKAAKPEKKLHKKKAAAAAPARAKKPKAASPRPTKIAKPAETAKTARKKARGPKSAPTAALAKKKPSVMPVGIAKPGLGHKWSCFNCGAKFYDLGKPVPVCPKCEADQRDRPPVVLEAPPAPPQPKRPAMAPMSRFLDDDEVAAPEPDEFGVAPVDETEETEAAEIDIDSLEEPAIAADADFSESEEE